MATQHGKQVKFPLLIAQDDLDHLQELAKESDRSLSGYLRVALKQHLATTAK
jgi:hypothetical protein